MGKKLIWIFSLVQYNMTVVDRGRLFVVEREREREREKEKEKEEKKN